MTILIEISESQMKALLEGKDAMEKVNKRDHTLNLAIELAIDEYRDCWVKRLEIKEGD